MLLCWFLQIVVADCHSHSYSNGLLFYCNCDCGGCCCCWWCGDCDRVPDQWTSGLLHRTLPCSSRSGPKSSGHNGMLGNLTEYLRWSRLVYFVGFFLTLLFWHSTKSLLLSHFSKVDIACDQPVVCRGSNSSKAAKGDKCPRPFRRPHRSSQGLGVASTL